MNGTIWDFQIYSRMHDKFTVSKMAIKLKKDHFLTWNDGSSIMSMKVCIFLNIYLDNFK